MSMYCAHILATNHCCRSAYSSKSSDRLIDHRKSVRTILEVDALPLVVHVVHVIDVTVDDWLHHINDQEEWDGREDQSYEVTRETDVDDTVAFKGAESLPQALVVWGGSEWSLLLAETWDVQVDSGAHLSLDLVALDHLNDLTLLLVRSGIVWSDLSEVLVEVVLHTF